MNMKRTNPAGPGIKAASGVTIVLHSPREKYWGMLDEISPAGVFLRGLELNAFESWLHAVAHDEPFTGLSDLFFPMWRVERIEKDEASGEVPSLSQQAERRTGRPVQELI